MANGLPYIPLGDGGGGGGGFDFGKLLGDRNFLSLLAGTGAGLDPQGPAGAIGGATQSYIQALASQEALAGQEKKREEFNKQLLALLGGLTPKEMPGPTSAKVTPEGVTLDITRPSETVQAGHTTTPVQPGRAATGGEKEAKLTDLGAIPFF